VDPSLGGGDLLLAAALPGGQAGACGAVLLFPRLRARRAGAFRLPTTRVNPLVSVIRSSPRFPPRSTVSARRPSELSRGLRRPL
jgi:hypothetical protein